MAFAEKHEAFLARLAASVPDGYSQADMHRDFNALFTGSPVGMRVYYALLDWSGMHANPTDPQGRDWITHQNIGRADFGRFVVHVTNEPPAPPPIAEAVTENPKENTDGR